ncbi:MAG: hypothetical protein LIO69_09430 [Oscillospiraceae bacterium]|nr:hypothetical protein [Oscillospiraceae bacterium]
MRGSRQYSEPTFPSRFCFPLGAALDRRCDVKRVRRNTSETRYSFQRRLSVEMP